MIYVLFSVKQKKKIYSENDIVHFVQRTFQGSQKHLYNLNS